MQAVNKGSVSIGRSFFQKSLRDYYRWKTAMCREFLQNSVDCGSTQINIKISVVEEHCTDELTQVKVIVSNNGRPMQFDELFGNLLKLGESNKSGSAIGGFGKAKEILYFAHKSYSIHSGEYRVTGSGADYQWYETGDDDVNKGTTSEVLVDLAKSSYSSHAETARQFVESWRSVISLGRYHDCLVVVNGTPCSGQLRSMPELRLTANRSKAFRLSNCRNEGSGGLVYVRSGGVLMFQRYIYGNNSYFVDLKQDGRNMLTANRDGLTSEFETEFGELIAKLSNNTMSSGNVSTKADQWMRGSLFKAQLRRQEEPVLVASQTTLSENSHGEEVQTTLSGPETETEFESDSSANTIVEQPEAEHFSYGILLAAVGGSKAPARYWKKGVVKKAVGGLLSRWANIVAAVHSTMGCGKSFGVGLIFDDSQQCHTLAKYQIVDGVGYYLINPIKGDKLRYKVYDWAQLAALAAHELAHASHSDHTEAFASRMTEIVGKCNADIQRIKREGLRRSEYAFNFPEAWE